MKRKAGVVAVVVLAVVAIVWWRTRGGSSHAGPSGAAQSGGPAQAALHRDARIDPRTVQRASIAGTVTDEDHAPVPHARVCAEGAGRHLPSALVRDAHCAAADDRGAYTIGELYAD